MATRLEAKRLWEAGESYNAVAAELNVATSSIKTWRKRDKWQRASDGSSNELAIAEPQEVEMSESLGDQAAQYEDDMRRAALTFSNYVADLPGVTIAAKSQHIKAVDQVARKALRIETEKPQPVINIGVLASSPAKLDRDRHLTLELD